MLHYNDYSDVEFESIFDFHNSQQFATVIFDRKEDNDQSTITVIQNGEINQFIGNNTYNPSERRISTCVYVVEEQTNYVIKICTVQHKGITSTQLREVKQPELKYLKLDPNRIKRRDPNVIKADYNGLFGQ